MKIIFVIDREFGAGASTAAKVASRLGWTLLDPKLTPEGAHLTNISADVCLRREERNDSWMQRPANTAERVKETAT